METLRHPGATGRHSELSFERFGDSPLLHWGDRTLSAAELARRCDQVGRALGPVRRLVQVPMRSDLGSIVAYLGARRAGHVVVLGAPEQATDPTWQPDVVLSGAGDDWDLEELRPGSDHLLHPDLALLLSTSGSTGGPRQVRLSARNLTSNALAIADYLRLGGDDVAITSLPLHYCYGLSVLHSHLVAGAGVALSDRSVLHDCFWELARERAVTSIAMVPHMLDLLDRAHDGHGEGGALTTVASLRRLTVAGGRAAPEQVLRYAVRGRRSGWDLFVMYGQTEATARMAYLPPELVVAHPGSIGVAIPGGELRLAALDGAGPDEGELVYRGDNVMMGYASRPADLARGPELDELRTGDLARRTTDGLFEIVGRRSRLAKLFGLRIDLDHLEARLASCGIEALCVEDHGALALVSTGTSTEVVRRSVAELAGLPIGSVRVALVGELPRSERGKPDRSGVAAACGMSTPPRNDTVRSIVADVLGLEDAPVAETFVSLGGDSLSYVEMSLRLEEALGHLPTNWHVLTIGELEDLAELATGPARPARCRGALRWRQVETSVAIRAVSVVLIVSSHVGLFRVRGGAHLLLAVAGFNFARFLAGPGRATTGADTWRTVGRIAVPSVVWIAMLNLAATGYHWSGALLSNSYLGPPRWTSAWRYWFIEALVWSVVLAALVCAVPAVRRAATRRPQVVAAVVLAVASLARFDLVSLGPTPEPLLAPHRVFWCFALGWLIARSDTTRWRIVSSLATVALVPGFFGEPVRDAVVIVGLLGLIWIPSVRVPEVAVRALAPVAAASLYIYLTHYQLYPHLLRLGLSEVVVVAASILVGIAVWRLADPVVNRLVERPVRRAGARRVTS